MLPDWFGVPSDVLELISKKLLSWDDYVRFRSVCTSWRSAAPKRPHLPLLVVKNSRSAISPCLEICNFPSSELYTPQQMPEGIAKHSSRGCSRGWLCSISSQNCRSTIYLHNPFTGAQISLPVMPYQAIPTKVVLSSDPILDPHNCVVMAKCSDPLVFHCSPGDASWTPSLEDFPDSSRDYIDDIIFYKGNSYAVSSFDRFFVSRLGPHDARFTEILPVDILPPVDINILTERYLVVSSGDLFMVVLTYTYEDKVSEFQIHTVAVGAAIGQACLLLAAGKKGQRFMMPHSKAMIQQPRVPSSGQMPASDVLIRAKEVINNRDTLVKLISRHTGNSLETVSKVMRRPFYMDAIKAKEFGVIDKILWRGQEKIMADALSPEEWDKKSGIKVVDGL